MASNLKYSTLLKNAQQDAITSQCGASAILTVYSGTQPASPDTAVSSQVPLSIHTCSATFAAAASSGGITMNSIGTGTGTAGAAGGTTATWFRITTSGAVAKIDGTVGTSAADMILSSTTIATGQTVTVTPGSPTFSNGN